jgi:hypothetical protein
VSIAKANNGCADSVSQRRAVATDVKKLTDQIDERARTGPRICVPACPSFAVESALI